MHNSPSANTKQTTEIYYGVGSFLFEIVKVFFLALIVIIPIRVFLFQPFFVEGASMEPNFHQGEYLVINEFGYKQTTIGGDAHTLFTVEPFKELSRGDVVVFRYPKNPSQFFIKRVVALPGEYIEIQNGGVAIFSDAEKKKTVLTEPYLRVGTKTTGSISMQLSDDEYFVMGDNRGASHDSRSWGALSKEFITGKVVFRAWPIENVGISFK